MTRHGLPAANTPAGMSRVTTLPAPITARSPMVTPGQMTTPPPILNGTQMTLTLPIGSGTSFYRLHGQGQ